MKLLKTKTLGLCLASIGIISSCHIPKATVQNNTNIVPKHFDTSANDSSSMAVKGIQDFFKDPYLKSIIKDVLNNNLDYNIALQKIEIAKAGFKQIRAALLPTLNLTTQSSATHYGKHTMEGVGNYDTNLSQNIDQDQQIDTKNTPYYWLGLQSQWEIDFWGKLRNAKKSAKQQLLASTWGTKWIQSQLVAQSALLYYELLALDRESKILEENIQLQNQAFEIVETQKMAGRATELAVQQFKAQLLNTKNTQLKIKQKIFVAEQELNFLLGKYQGDIKRSSDIKFNKHFEDYTQVGLPADMLLRRPDVQQAAALLESSKADVKAARAAFFPSISLNSYMAFNAFKGNLLFLGSSLGYQLLGGITAPIFQQNSIKAHYKISNAQQQEAFYQFKKTSIQAYQEVTVQFNALSNYKNRIAVKKAEVEALENGVSISKDLYLTGYASYLEIIAAQKSKLEAQIELVEIQKMRIGSHIELYKALGGAWD